MNLPIIFNKDEIFQLFQSKWSSILNPFLSNISNNTSILTDVPITAGTNVINHYLGKKLTGWRIIRIKSAAKIYDRQDSNPIPNLTLVLISDIDAIVSLEVF